MLQVLEKRHLMQTVWEVVMWRKQHELLKYDIV